ncbi:MAG: DUF1926 domain-containing protein [candidate division Zixibacteria bacterium]|nr:DUF1926 domain-containing protein [candidate division Zixibacteria bacterium]
MDKFKLAFGIHNHQPVGNFAAVFDDAHRQAYRPFLELLEEYDDISISLHQSGILWDWQKVSDPSYFELVGRMVDRGRLELITGGFYEPILTSIPSRDALNQIALLTSFLHSHFDASPTGLWLTERIWEPHLPSLLARAGVKYLPIDDTHFIYAGFNLNQLSGPFVTEDEGHAVTLLPIQKRLRYLLPFGKVEELIDELKMQANRNPKGLAVYADDGEKFGVWPHTHEHCYTDGWLRDFFDAVMKNTDWLEIVPLGVAAAMPSVGRAYLPSASYEEMLHWSLPAPAFREYEEFERWLSDSGQKVRYGRFVRGGHWRGFLAKYDESNLMHKSMLRISAELDTYLQSNPEAGDEVAAIRHDLYASQCNCPYWHGVFGGLYLPHIRQAVYSRMIEAHAALRKLGKFPVITTDMVDYDMDGNDEVVVDSDDFTAVFKPRLGGTLLHLALNRRGFNVTDTLTRRKEGYHLKLDQAVSADTEDSGASIHDLVMTKEPGLSQYLLEDWYLKRCLIDHFLSPEVEAGDFVAGKFGEEGDFVLEPYDVKLASDGRSVILSRLGHVFRAGQKCPVQIQKTAVFTPGCEYIDVTYTLSSSFPGGVAVNFAVENNFNFQAGHAEDRFVLVDGVQPEESYLDSTGVHKGAFRIALVDQFRQLAAVVAAEEAADIWHQPIFTVSLSEGGFEKVYQGTTILHRYRLKLTDQPSVLHFRLSAGAEADVLRKKSSSDAVCP